MAAAFTPLGNEFLIPSENFSVSHLHIPEITGLADGGYVIVWPRFVSGENYNVFAQRYDASGTKVGAEITVNTFTDDAQYAPSIAGLSDGGFIITWNSYNQDGNPSGVYGQRYDASGSTVGAEFQINSFDESGTIRNSEVSALADGGFIVTWESTSQDGVSAQRYDSNGDAVGNEFLIDTVFSTVGAKAPAITGLTDGGFVATWDAYALDGTKGNVFAQVFDANGDAVAATFTVNTYTADWQSTSSVSALGDGGFVVVWHSDINQDGIGGDGVGSQDGSADGVYGQRYDATGAPVGSEFQVNTTTAGDQNNASIAALADGGFVVVWASDGQDGEGFGTFGQRYDANGDPIEGEFQINTQTQGDEYKAEVTALANGGFVVTWVLDDSDSDADGIYGQQFAAQLFGTSGNDVITDTFGANWLDGQSGDDILYGATGKDQIYGGSGNDALFGGKGKDTLFGGSGDDVLSGGKGDDTLIGGEGIDTADYSSETAAIIADLKAGSSTGSSAGFDTFQEIENVTGTAFKDVITGDAQTNILDGGAADDKLKGLAGSDILYGKKGADKLYGGADSDSLFGGKQGDTLYGGKGQDQLFGGAGKDDLRGGKGADTLVGGTGDDILKGASGADIFVFSSNDGSDTILDYKDNTDKIDLSGFGFLTKAEALSHFYEKGSASNDVVGFDYDGTTIRIEGADLGDINGGDIII